MITALDQLTLDPALAAQQQSSQATDPNLFASRLSQALAGNPSAQAQPAQATAGPANSTALLATQVAQLWSQQGQAGGATAQPARSEQEEKSQRDNAVLQSLNCQAGMAFSQHNVGAFNVLEVMIGKQMTDMGLIQKPATAQPAAPKTAAKVAAQPVRTARRPSYSAAAMAQAAASNASTVSSASTAVASNAATTSTASNASTASSASADAASNASTANSASASLSDVLASNAATGGSASARTASNAGTGGATAQAVDDALDHLTWELKTLLSGLEGDKLDSALADLDKLSAELAQSTKAA